MRRILISTVGTSLKGNLLRQYADLFESGAEDVKQVVLDLAGIDPGDRKNGAEINSINGILNKGMLKNRDALYFLVSDTKDGAIIGHILKSYFQRRQNP